MNKYLADQEAYVNKVAFGDEIIMDISDELENSVTPEDLKAGVKTFDKSGANIVGTNTNNCDTREDTVEAADVLVGKSFHTGQGNPAEGAMPNHNTDGITLDAEAEGSQINIPYGFYALGSKITVTNIEANEIAEGKTIFGVVGTHSAGEAIVYDSVNNKATPKRSTYTVYPDTGKVFNRFTINAIPYSTSRTAGTNGYTYIIAPTT